MPEKSPHVTLDAHRPQPTYVMILQQLLSLLLQNRLHCGPRGTLLLVGVQREPARKPSILVAAESGEVSRRSPTMPLDFDTSPST